jgi:hypothetical protein
MAEEYVLTDPIVIPAQSTTKYRVVVLTLNFEAITTPWDQTAPGSKPGLIMIDLRDDLGQLSHYQYVGDEAIDLMKFLNTANLTIKSMHKRILEKLTTDGLLPPGTVAGTPDPPTTGL